jgi:hypothetical protein
MSGPDTGSILVRSSGKRVMCSGTPTDCEWFLASDCAGYAGQARLPRPEEPGVHCGSLDKKTAGHWCYEAYRVLVAKKANRCYVNAAHPGRIA